VRASFLFLVVLLGALPGSARAQFPGGGAGHQGQGQQSHQGKAQPVPDSTGIIPRPSNKSGCSSFDLQIGASGSISIARAPDGSPPCGPIIPTVTGLPTYDSSTHVVRVQLALTNSGLVRLHAPALLIGNLGSLVPAGRRPNASILHFINPDSAAPDSVTHRGAESFWRFDTLLYSPKAPPVTGEDGAIVLPAGMTSMPRTVAIQVAPGISAFRLNIGAMGMYVFTVPAQPALRVPADEIEDSRAPGNSITGDPHFPGRVVRNKLWLMFRKDATAEQREAAIELVDGVVVGGTIRASSAGGGGIANAFINEAMADNGATSPRDKGGESGQRRRSARACNPRSRRAPANSGRDPGRTGRRRSRHSPALKDWKVESRKTQKINKFRLAAVFAPRIRGSQRCVTSSAHFRLRAFWL
jgi:hypothetical protein